MRAGRALRTAFTALGILALAGIAVAALVNLGIDLALAARRLDQPGVPLAVVLNGVAAAGAVAAVATVGWVAGRGRRGERIALGAGLLILVALRVAVAVLIDGVTDGEMAQYRSLAEGVLSGSCCFGDRPMGYPVALAAVYAALGVSTFADEMVNTAFAAVAGLALFGLVRAAYGPRAAGVALAAYAVWPAGVLLTVVRLPETGYDAAILLGAVAAVVTRPGIAGSALTGGILGLAQYFRPSTTALLPAFILARAWGHRRAGRSLVTTAVPVLALFLVVLLPAVEHNLRTHGALSVDTSSYGGWSLYMGTNQRTGGRFSPEDAERLEAAAPGSKWEQSRVGARLGMQRITDDPVGFAALAARKVVTLWGTEDDAVDYALQRRLSRQAASTFPGLLVQGFWVVATVAAAFGLWLQRAAPGRLAVLTIGVTLTVTAIHAFLEVRSRYHAYVVPLLLAMAAVGLVSLAERWRADRAPRASTAVPDDRASPGPPRRPGAEPAGTAATPAGDGSS
jgi:hypothetical protein